MYAIVDITVYTHTLSIHITGWFLSSVLMHSGGEDGGFAWGLVFWPAIHRHQRLSDMAETGQKGILDFVQEIYIWRV